LALAFSTTHNLRHPDPPEWLSHVNAAVLKVKLATAIIGISPIHLLKTFAEAASSLSDLKNRSENLTGRSQISSILKGNSSSIARESGGIWIVQADLQPISFKSDRLLGQPNSAVTFEAVLWQTVDHPAFVILALAIAWVGRIMSKPAVPHIDGI